MHHIVRAETEISVPSHSEIEEQNKIEMVARTDASGKMFTLRFSMPRPCGGFRLFRQRNGDAETEELVAGGEEIRDGDEINVPAPLGDLAEATMYKFRIEAKVL